MSEKKATILLVDDEQHILNSLGRLLRLHGFETSCHLHTGEALLELRQRKFDLVISDQKMPVMKGTEFLAKAGKIVPNLRSILLSGYNEFDDVIDAFNVGLIQRFIAKPWDNAALISQIEEILLEEVEYPKKIKQEPGKKPESEPGQLIGELGGIVSHSAEMNRVISLISKTATTNFPVLLIGETGSGKDWLATAIHKASERKNNKFVAVNCADFSEENLELKLFGREQGYARTTSSERESGQLGLLALAHKGTLFLDGVTALPSNLQAKLLRLIEDRDFSPIGSNKKIPIDTRLITSADTPLEVASREGVFRDDLRFRLDVISVSVPPLRDRSEDILPLFYTFLGKALGNCDINKTEIDVLLIDCLRHYKWPGNVRELENLCSKIAVQIESDYEYLSVNILPSQILESVLDDYDAGVDMITLDQLEKGQLQRLLDEFPGRMDSAAKFLGVSPMSLLKKVKKLNL